MKSASSCMRKRGKRRRIWEKGKFEEFRNMKNGSNTKNESNTKKWEENILLGTRLRCSFGHHIHPGPELPIITKINAIFSSVIKNSLFR